VFGEIVEAEHAEALTQAPLDGGALLDVELEAACGVDHVAQHAELLGAEARLVEGVGAQRALRAHQRPSPEASEGGGTVGRPRRASISTTARSIASRTAGSDSSAARSARSGRTCEAHGPTARRGRSSAARRRTSHDA